MIACEAIMVATVAKRHDRIMRPPGGQQIERIGDRARVRQQQRALSEVVQHQARQYHGEPAQPYRQRAEMTHVGIHRLAAGNREKGGAEDCEADRRAGVHDVGERTQWT
jgi:hypothetical protein